MFYHVKIACYQDAKGRVREAGVREKWEQERSVGEGKEDVKKWRSGEGCGACERERHSCLQEEMKLLTSTEN